MKLVIDIETVAYDFNSLAPSQQEFILRYPGREPDEEIRKSKTDDAIRYLSLYPYTAKVIVIGMRNVESGKTLVLYESDTQEDLIVEEKNTKYLGLSEPEMLQFFWDQSKKTEQIITFNGKNFDLPFLMIRSAVHQINPTRDFVKAAKFGKKSHIDLLDKLTFYGSIRKFNLDFYCHSFGIDSPKDKDITGMEVKELYSAGKTKDIAVYCADDLRATAELFEIWDKFINI